MSRFNLIDEPWIPIRYLDGRREELGIKSALLRAKEIATIEDASPLVVASLHRFLLAVLYRALEGPTDIDQAKALFKEGIPADKITTYLEKWRGRFWLFDEKYPFGQNPNVPPDEIEPWTKLTAEFNATSNKVLFDHTDTKTLSERAPRECTRWLLSTMTFSISGGRGYFPSPSPNAMICLAQGKNLQETLCFNLVPYSNKEVQHADSAMWEREPSTFPLAQQKRASAGYADLYTWPARMVHLEESPTGGVTVMRFIAGEGFENPTGTPDPMQPYKLHKDHGRLPVQFRDDRAAWRDFDSLLPDQDGLAPLTLQNSVRLSKGGPRSLLVLGLKYKPPNANLEFWRMERFALPGALAGDKFIRSDIKRFLDRAEDANKTLWSACSSYARGLLSRGDREPHAKDVKSFVSQLNCLPWYWSTLEVKFQEMLQHYSLDRNADEIELDWLNAVRTGLIDSWELHRASVSTGEAWTIRALVKAEVPLYRKLSELDKTIQEYQPKGTS